MEYGRELTSIHTTVFSLLCISTGESLVRTIDRRLYRFASIGPPSVSASRCGKSLFSSISILACVIKIDRFRSSSGSIECYWVSEKDERRSKTFARRTHQRINMARTRTVALLKNWLTLTIEFGCDQLQNVICARWHRVSQFDIKVE